MSGSELQFGMGRYFPPVESIHHSEHSVADFITQCRSSLTNITDVLEKQTKLSPLVAQQVRESIDTYSKNADHGARHSYFVYQGMKLLSAQEGIEISDETCQALSILHDLSQYLPLVNPISGEKLAGDVRKLHPETMAETIVLFGKSLGLKPSEIRDLSIAVRHHDDTYTEKGIYDHMPLIGKVLADADKLFASSTSRDPAQMAKEVIERNLLGSDDLQGWYLLRDLTPEQRNGWQYGDRWLSDRVSAVRRDIFHTPFYTQTAKDLGEARRVAFLQQAKIAYGREYDQTQENLNLWYRTLSDKSQIQIGLIGKNPHSGNKSPAIEPLSSDANPSELIDQAFTKPLQTTTRPGHEDPRGWKIRLIIKDTQIVIDPSIARFSSKEAFLDTLVRAFIN